MKYVILASLWTAWCAVHSLLISLPVRERLKRRLGNGFRYYRIFYNGFSGITLMFVVLYTHSVETEALFAWEGPFRILQILLLLFSIFLFWGGAKHYDAKQFLGIRQLRHFDSCAVLTENCELDTTGILSMMRHPWYLAVMIIVWARAIDFAVIVTNTIMTGYFVIGTILEERKLTVEFGNSYREYQRTVSMFFPFKWFKTKLRPQSPQGRS